MIMILTYGKVGSTSLMRVLSARFPGSVFYSHGLQPGMTEILEGFVRASPGLDTSNLQLAFADNPEIKRRLQAARGSGESVTILAGVRDPVARSLSVSMQMLSLLFFECLSGDSSRSAACVASRLRDLWINSNPTDDPLRRLALLAIHAPFTWLRDEIEAPFGFDVGAEPFDTEQGYKILVRENIRLFLYRIENGPGALSAGLEEMFRGHQFELPFANASKDKSNGSIYAPLKEQFALPCETTERIYHSCYVRPFFTDREIQAAKARWSERAG